MGTAFEVPPLVMMFSGSAAVGMWTGPRSSGTSGPTNSTSRSAAPWRFVKL
jgi:hypothetical protein